MKILRRPQARVGVIPSPLGKLLVAESDRGLAAIHFLFISGGDRTLELLRRKFDLIENEPSARRIGKRNRSRVRGRYRRGRASGGFEPGRERLPAPRVHLAAKGPGRRGDHLSGAGRDGRESPDAQRAIGTTMATNPIPIFVPCHRVIKSDGTIGNYGGGVDNKIKLLRAEGFDVGRDLRLPSRAVMGHRHTQNILPARLLGIAPRRSEQRADLRGCANAQVTRDCEHASYASRSESDGY